MRINVLKPQTNWACQSGDQRLSFFVLYNYSVTFYVFSLKSSLSFLPEWSVKLPLFRNFVLLQIEHSQKDCFLLMSHLRHQNNLQSLLRAIFTVAWGEEWCGLLEIFDISEFHDHKDTQAGSCLGKSRVRLQKILLSILNSFHWRKDNRKLEHRAR